MADEKTVTEREAVLRERNAFHNGACWERSYRQTETGDLLRLETERLYPLPVKKRPLRVTLNCGQTYSYACEGKMVCHGPRHPGDTTQYPAVIELWRLAANCKTAEDFRKFARCLDGELEDVPEGEE